MQNGTNTPETPAPAAYRGEPRYEVPPQRRRDLPYKQGWLAGMLSGLFPGLGQVYVGYYRHGIVIATIFVVIITAVSSSEMSGLEPLLGMSIGFTWLYGIVDAARRAQAVNRALDGMAGHELPEDVELPGTGGSMVGGILLVILGVILVAHTRFDVDMAWLADWWPLALIGFGGWLIYKGRAEKSAPGGDKRTYDREGGVSRDI